MFCKPAQHQKAGSAQKAKQETVEAQKMQKPIGKQEVVTQPQGYSSAKINASSYKVANSHLAIHPTEGLQFGKWCGYLRNKQQRMSDCEQEWSYVTYDSVRFILKLRMRNANFALNFSTSDNRVLNTNGPYLSRPYEIWEKSCFPMKPKVASIKSWR